MVGYGGAWWDMVGHGGKWWGMVGYGGRCCAYFEYFCLYPYVHINHTLDSIYSGIFEIIK